MLENVRAAIFSRRRRLVRAVIFVTLHLILFLSLTECALALYLFSTKQVDGPKTPSLVLGFVASLLSIPFVVLHTLISIQYRNTARYNFPNSALHIACLHLPRIMIITWLAASVAGLIVMSKQANCARNAEGREPWRRKLSCQVYQTAIIFDIIGFFATCALLFCFKICERPYDASLLGLSAPKRPVRGGSLFSESSAESERLKHQVFYLCRHPDAGPDHDALYLTPKESSLLDAATRPSGVRYPGSTRIRPELRISTHFGSTRPSITTRDSPKNLPVVDRSKSVRSQHVSPLSRNPSAASSLPSGTEETITTQPPLPAIPDAPEAPRGAKHKRQQSSTSSNKFLPKPCASTQPLSEDPQIRNLSCRPLTADNDSEVSSNNQDSNSSIASGSASTEATSVSSPTPTAKEDGKTETKSTHSDASSESKRQFVATSSGEPPLALPSVPLSIHKSQPSHKESYAPPLAPPSTPSIPRIPPRSLHYRSTTQPALRSHNPRIRPARLSATQREYSSHHCIPQNYCSSGHYRRQHYQHLHHPQPRCAPRPATAYQPRRFHSYHSRFVPSQTLPPIPQDDDVAIVYPSARRPRSSTYGESRPGPMGDVGGHRIARHTSLNLSPCYTAPQGERAATDARVYRGAERTSMSGLR